MLDSARGEGGHLFARLYSWTEIDCYSTRSRICWMIQRRYWQDCPGLSLWTEHSGKCVLVLQKLAVFGFY